MLSYARRPRPMAAMGNLRRLRQRSDVTAGGRTVLVTGMALGVGSAFIWRWRRVSSWPIRLSPESVVLIATSADAAAKQPLWRTSTTPSPMASRRTRRSASLLRLASHRGRAVTHSFLITSGTVSTTTPSKSFKTSTPAPSSSLSPTSPRRQPSTFPPTLQCSAIRMSCGVCRRSFPVDG